MSEKARCQAKAENGPCVLPKGHNQGRADIPANHSAEIAQVEEGRAKC